MTTTYYVVPANRFFEADVAWESFPSLPMALRHIKEACDTDACDYGIFELRPVAGSARLPFDRMLHVVGNRRIITGKHYLGGYSAHDDGLGEDGSPYGYGKTPEEAIAELLEALDPGQNRAAQAA